MNTEIDDQDYINPDFAHLFELNSEKDKIEHDAKMLMFRFLSEIEKLDSERGYKKRLADLIGKSQSFITQLFNGDKLASLTTLAKLQAALKIKFKVKAYAESDFYSQSDMVNVEQNNVMPMGKIRPIQYNITIDGETLDVDQEFVKSFVIKNWSQQKPNVISQILNEGGPSQLPKKYNIFTNHE